MYDTPGGDILVVVAVADAAADDEQWDLGQRMQTAPHVTGIPDLAVVVEQRGKA